MSWTEAISQRMANVAFRRPKARRDKTEGATVGLSTSQPTAGSDPSVTGSIGPNPASPLGPGKVIRVIAPDIIPVPVR
jgi:hypothetical protein